MIVSIFFDNNKKTKLFSDFSEPKFYIKKIKNKDDYLSYIVYSHLMYLIKDDYKISRELFVMSTIWLIFELLSYIFLYIFNLKLLGEYQFVILEFIRTLVNSFDFHQ